MLRCFLCLTLLLLTGCEETGTPGFLRDPAFPDQPTYVAFVRQHLLLTEGKVLAHFPGLLDCDVSEQTEGFTPDELKVMDAYARQRNMPTIDAAANAQRARMTRLASSPFESRHPECADIRALPGAYGGGKDFIIESFLNSNAPIFDQQDVSTDIRQAVAACYWDLYQAQLSPDQLRELDSFARGGPQRLSSIPKIAVTRNQMMLKCTEPMVKLENKLTIVTIIRYRD